MTESPRFDPVALLAAKWRAVAVLGALGGATGLTYGLVAPKWYEATLTVVPSQKSSSPALGLLANLPGADALGASSSTDVQRIQAVLRSNSVADEVIAKFDLKTTYYTPHIEHARLALWEHCSTSADRKSGVVTLTCEDHNPDKAMRIAAYFGEVGNRVFGRISASSAREERKFLETQVVKARNDVDTASRELQEFQEKHKIVDLPEQSKAVISAMASVEGDLVSKQLELSYLSSFSSRSEANVVQLQQQIAIMEAKLKELENSQTAIEPSPDVPANSGRASGSAANAPNAKFFPDAMRVPELRFQLEQLLRAQKIKETVFFLLTQRFETAKVDEARDTSTFQILDQPTLPTYRSRPRPKRLGILGLFAGLSLVAAWVVGPAWWRNRTRTAA